MWKLICEHRRLYDDSSDFILKAWFQYIHIMSPGLLNIYTHGSEFLNKRHDLMSRFSLQSPFIAWDVVHGSFSCVTWIPVLTLWPVHIWHRIQVTMWSVRFTYLYFIWISICMFILLVCVYFMYNIWPVYRATQLNHEYMHIKWCLGKMVHRKYIVKLTVCTDNHWKLSFSCYPTVVTPDEFIFTVE